MQAADNINKNQVRINSNKPQPVAFQLSGYNISLEFFSGPMDLLLHLVSQQEVPVEKVEMAAVCKQYLEIVLRDINNLDIERAMEFLVIAATLMAIKSSALLPSSTEENLQAGFEDFDPRFFEDLRARLIAYRNTKLRAEALERTPQLGVDTFSRGVKVKEYEEEYLRIDEGDPFSLSQAFIRMLKRVGSLAHTLKISIESVTIVSSMMKIIDYLKVSSHGLGEASFKSIVYKLVGLNKKNIQTRVVAISGFLGILELAKRGLLAIKKKEGSDEFDVLLHLDTAEQVSTLEDNEWDVQTPNDKVVNIDDYRNRPEELLESSVDSESDDTEQLREVVHGQRI